LAPFSEGFRFLALGPKGHVGAGCTAQTNCEDTVLRQGKEVELIKAREIGVEMK
jgi:hypothetical protein